MADEWKDALINECILNHIGWDEGDPRKTIRDLIAFEVETALDPRVSSSAQALMDRGAERASSVAASTSLKPTAEMIGVGAAVLERMLPAPHEDVARAVFRAMRRAESTV